MALVTDLKYYLDDDLKALLDLCIDRKKKGWDNLLIIDGKERSGKTTLAKAICKYYAHETKKNFNLDNALEIITSDFFSFLSPYTLILVVSASCLS